MITEWWVWGGVELRVLGLRINGAEHNLYHHSQLRWEPEDGGSKTRSQVSWCPVQYPFNFQYYLLTCSLLTESLLKSSGSEIGQ